jgi:predicted permease
MLSDLKFAFRQLAKFPGYTLVVVLTLGFGVAVNTNIFGIVGHFFLQEMPVADADRLALILERSDAFNMPHGISFPDFQDYRARAASFGHLLAYFPQPAHVSTDGHDAERGWIEVVSANGFTALNVPAALGRTLLPSDRDDSGAPPVAVLTHRYWQRRFGGDPSVIGRTLTLNGKPFTIVGVARAGFNSFGASLIMDAFVPAGAIVHVYGDGLKFLDNRGISIWRALGKLKPGITIAAANTEIAVLSRQIAQDFPDTHKNTHHFVIAENRCRPDPSVADFTAVFSVLFVGVVILVLIIACANVANLMLARAITRQKELTMRAALGASRWRLIRQLLVESLLLAALAGFAGWFLARSMGDLFARFTPQGDIPINTDSTPATRDYLFTIVVSLVAGLASGLAPALRASRVDLVESMKEGAGSRVAGGKHHLRNFLVVGQVMFSLVVLICAGLFLQSLNRARSVALGFRPDHLLMASFDLGLGGYTEQRGQQFTRQLLEKVRAFPGVDAASVTQYAPFDYYVQVCDVWPENAPHLQNGSTSIKYTRVDPGYLPMMGLRLARGRLLAETDNENAPRVTVVNRALADVCWPGQDAIGKRLRLWRDGPLVEVVGVMETAKYWTISEPPQSFLYLPLRQDYFSPLTLMVRTKGDPALLVNAVRAAVRALDPNLPLYGVHTLDELMDQSIFGLLPMRMGAAMAAVQGAIGLLLAVMGLFAVVSYGVSRRTKEIGVRMALGANATDVVRLVVREGMRLTVTGLALGLVLALGLGVVLSKLLYGLGLFDPMVFLAVTAVLLGTTALACWLPARKAAKTDPMIALRSE